MTEPARPTRDDGHALRLDFRFDGSGGEYFSIWIVNLLLSLLTLGLYSPWAKVRRERYFHRVTLLDGQPFDYTGNPVSILKGRLLALAVVAAGSLVQQVNVALALAVTAVFALLYPWVVVRSLRFRARNTRWRNLMFRFTGTTRQAFAAYAWIYAAVLPFVLASLVYNPELQAAQADPQAADAEAMQRIGKAMVAAMIGSMLMLVALWPVYLSRVKRFLHGNLCYGSASGAFDGGAGTYFRALAGVGGISVLALILVVLIAGGLGAAAGTLQQPWIGALGPLLILPVLYLPQAAYMTRVTNATYARAALGELRFASGLKVLPLAWLMFTSLLMLLLTLGMAWPWVVVRVARFRLENLAVLAAPGSVDVIVGRGEADVAAFGEEAAEFLDFDLSL